MIGDKESRAYLCSTIVAKGILVNTFVELESDATDSFVDDRTPLRKFYLKGS